MTDDVGKLVRDEIIDLKAQIVRLKLQATADARLIDSLQAHRAANSRKMPDEAEIERAGRAIAARAGETYDLTPIGKSYFDGLARAAFGIE